MVQICTSGRNTLNPHRAAAFLLSVKSSSPEAGPHPCPVVGRDAEGTGAWLSPPPPRQKAAPTRRSYRAALKGTTIIKLGYHKVSPSFWARWWWWVRAQSQEQQQR